MFVCRRQFALVAYRCLFSDRTVPGFRRLSEYSSHESSKFMQKLLNKRGVKQKKKWYQSHVGEPLELGGTLHKTNKRGVTPAQRIRATQLSHVLYDRVSQLINTGELSEEILNKQVLITSVRMLPNFDGIHVFWDSSRSDAFEVEELLQSHEKKLRGLLISYHVLGRIPPVTFVKDRQHGDLTALHQLLEIADYGPDYIPSSEDKRTMSVASAQLSNPNRWSSPEEDLSTKLGPMDLNRSSGGAPGFQSAQNGTDVSFSREAGWENGNSSAHSATEEWEKSPGASETTNLTSDLNFRSNLYGLPRNDLMRKVIAKKTNVKFQGRDSQQNTTEHNLAFNVKQLAFQKDKLKAQKKSSSKMKYRLLERNFEDEEHDSFVGLDDENNFSTASDDEVKRK